MPCRHGHPAAGRSQRVALRRERGLSQEGLAFEAEIHRTYVSGVERSVRNPTITVLAELATALKVPPHEFLSPVPEDPARPKKRGYSRRRR